MALYPTRVAPHEESLPSPVAVAVATTYYYTRDCQIKMELQLQLPAAALGIYGLSLNFLSLQVEQEATDPRQAPHHTTDPLAELYPLR